MGGHVVFVSCVRAVAQARNSSQPYNHHVAAQALPDFPDEKVDVRQPHANRDDGDWHALVAARDGEETAFSAKPEKLGTSIKERCDTLRPRLGTDGDLDAIRESRHGHAHGAR